MTKCPYCGRKLREHERYCDFCEQDITKAVEEAEKPKISHKHFKEDIERVKRISKNLITKIKKKLKKKNE